MAARVVGIGQAAAGDDAVGLAVLERLRRRAGLNGVELVQAAEPSALIPLLEGAEPVIVVDALLGGTPGAVLCLTPDELATERVEALSTHGVGVAEAVALARLLSPENVAAHVHVVGVCVARVERWETGLSAPVEAAVAAAEDAVLQLLANAAPRGAV